MRTTDIKGFDRTIEAAFKKNKQEQM